MMHLLVAVIERGEDVEPILSRFYENGITGATVLDSRGMSHMIAEHYSIFARFGDLTGSREGEIHNTVLFTVIREEETLDRAIEIIDEIVDDLEEPNTGLVFSVPLDRVKGLAAPLEED